MNGAQSTFPILKVSVPSFLFLPLLQDRDVGYALLPLGGAGGVDAGAARVDSDGHRHIDDIEFVDRFHAQVGKAERGPVAIDAIKEFGAVYLMAVGGAAYLVSKAIHGSRLIAFGDLGMEAIYEFDVRDMPVTVAVDSKGTSVHNTGPAEWQQRIAGIPILQ